MAKINSADSASNNKSWLLNIIFVALGLLLSAWLYVVLDARERATMAAEFDRLVSQKMQGLRAYNQRSIEVIYGLASFLRDPHNRNRQSFNRYVKGSLDRLPELQALEWIPIVDREQAPAFVEQARAQGFADYVLKEFSRDGRLQNVSLRERYYPVYFVYPEQNNWPAVGLDLGSQPDRLEAIHGAIQARDIVASAPVRLAQEQNENVYSVLIFFPVFSISESNAIDGFALAIFRSVDLLQPNFADLAGQGITVKIHDSKQPQVAIFSNRPTQHAGDESRFSMVREFEIGHRAWITHFSASAVYVAQQRGTGVLIYPVSFAFMVLVLGGYLHLKNRHITEIEAKVADRTRALTLEVKTRKDAEHKATLAEQMYRSIFENSIDGIFQTTRDGRYLNANTALAKIYGYSSKEEFLEGVKAKDIHTQLYVDPNRRDEFVRKMNKDGRVSDFISQVYTKSGDKIWILEKSISVFDEQGEFKYFEGNVQDVTAQVNADEALKKSKIWLEHRVEERTSELARINQALTDEVRIRKVAELDAEQANSAKTQFLACMSHEIRTPLNAIIGYSQILHQQSDVADHHRKLVKIICESGNHLLGLVDEILAFSKIESGVVELKIQDFDLSSLIENISYVVRKRCEDRNLTLKVEGLGAKAQWVRGDDGKLRQVLINLLANAVKYTDKGEVILRVVPLDGNTYRFEIIDTGQGIPAEEQSKIFDQFYQRANWQDGTGLGLSISARLVALLGGELRVQSSVGHGSNFYFFLSFESALAPSASATGGTIDRVHLHNGQQCSVLIVDDVQHNIDILRQILEVMGCAVIAAENADKALEYLKIEHPDIIFIDIFMPGMDGVALRKHILETIPDIRSKIVAFSAAAYSEQRAQFIEDGFDGVLCKPFRVEDIVCCLEDLLQVAFEKSLAAESDKPPAAEFQQLAISTEIYRELVSAASDYNMTRLKNGLKRLAAASDAHQRYAMYLAHLAAKHDIDELLASLDKVLVCSDQSGGNHG